MTSTLLVLLLLSQAERPEDPPAGAMKPPLPASLAGGGHSLTRVEDSGLALLPGGGAEGLESYAQRTPMLVLDGGEALGVNLGAPVRLRVGGGVAGAGLVRREDWDSLSDWGQLYSGQVRWRFGHTLDALAEGGALLFPEADGALRPGAFASLGLGVDNAR
ncbi:MAG TPA: hypothetical protein VFZ09_38700 [Archangium sp.]|uniref:hypothetical protein n=1 Tax=Archangium sp. TaxID=1872627 RepID=UPI002E379D11|nr:hypothetical protein [Archangium sp.]HEX5752208.1 hypothetical protein [Archangium sp.]